MPQPSSPTKPKRRNSLREQWDTTTKVVNVKQKIHSNITNKYTELQKSTFTKWVNIQLRMIDINQLDNSSRKKIPEIEEIDKDFRDGKKLIRLLEILYPNDSDLPKLERGNTRHHHIANVSKILKFLQKHLDEKGLTALAAIGAEDIVDGNVKLTLGLIWLTISKFIQAFDVQFEVTEEELEEVEERFKENINNKKEYNKHDDIQKFLFNNDENEIESFEEFQQQFRSHFINVEEIFNKKIVAPTIYEEEEINTCNEQTSAEDKSSITSPTPIPPEIIVSELPKKNLQDLTKSEKRLSLPIFQPTITNNNKLNDKNLNQSPKQFRTLRLNSSPINSNTSNLLFWINMQLINYTSLLPSSNYPLEDFIGLNDGIILSVLIQCLNIEWDMEDLNLLNSEEIKIELSDTKDLSEEELREREIFKELKAKERLSKCFNIIERKLNVQQPKALISMLIEKDYIDKERLKRTGLAWSVYISEVFLTITKSKNQRKEMKRRSSTNQIFESMSNTNEEVPKWNTHVEYCSIKNGSNKSRISHFDNLSSICDWVDTEKLHGANLSFITNGKEIKCARRSAILREKEQFYNHQIQLQKYSKNIFSIYNRMKEKDLIKGEMIIIYGELFGEFLPFDLFDGKDFVDFDITIDLFKENDIPHVKELSRDYENLAVGIVIKPIKPLRTDNGSRVILKIKIEDFEERKRVNINRLESVISKQGELNEENDNEIS
ncbi:1631_t:CDS:2 [Funneliformis geosporum]|uniref:1631_t:CDS:1 n=1 Tax=Funneliformis geosporum TaxID=1117311 RepID=A0A9W4SLY2_9GLOM|nr:1631_t:CDS:2 [Funneliformis geosporum]